MKFKRVITFICAIIMTSFTMTIYAATEDFHVYINGGSVVSSKSSRKATTTDHMTAHVNKRTGTTVNWRSSEKVNLRGRTSSGEKCTVLGSRNTEGSSQLAFYSGHGHVGDYYKIAVQYASDNPYKHLDLTVTWYAL